MAEAKARISGTLVALSVKEGDVVRKGQVIGRVADDRLGFQTRTYDAQISAASAQAAAANADLSRTRDLYEHGVYAKARLDQVEAQAKAADGALSAARAERAASAALSGQGAIFAPAAGRVLTAPVPTGSVVAAGQSVATITAGPTVVRLAIPEVYAAALKPGDKVKLDFGRGQTATSGAIVQVYPAVQDGQVTADVSAASLPTDLVGSKVRVWVKVGERGALLLPRQYLVTRYGVDYVRVAAPGGAVSDMPVETAAGPTPDQVEIMAGLQAGDVIALPEGGR